MIAPAKPVHPHTRGEHFTNSKRSSPSTGSSPHTWGTHFNTPILKFTLRFIPTHVGNTTSNFSVRLAITVHPHTRGEHIIAEWLLVTRLGSSPHTWGTHIEREIESTKQRFIPTHVGNTMLELGTFSLMSVHPHTRGAHHPFNYTKEARAGSSPHTWGTQ